VTTMDERSEAKRQLLEWMRSGAGVARIRETARIVARAPDMVVPIALEQAQLWLHAEMAGDVPIYNEAATIHRRGPFDLSVMERSVNALLQRHEIWRTSFESVDGDLVQIVHPDAAIHLTLDDLTALPPAEREAEALRLATEDVRRPFDLRTAPLLRCRVVKFADDEHRLYLAIHHIIFDGVSLSRVFVPELAAVYDAFASGAGSPLAAPALQYGDYAVWQRQQAAAGPSERQMDYWRRTLGGRVPTLELAGDHPRSPLPGYRGAMETFALPSDLTEALKALSRAESATLYMTLLAAFKAMLFRYTGQEDILVGGVTDLRRRPELERMMGYFLNIMALRTRPAADLPFRDYLAQTRDRVIDALDASEVPLDRVMRDLAIDRGAGAHPIFQAMFSMQPLVDPFAVGWDLTQMDVEVGVAKFDLYLELEERPDGMIGRFIYRNDLFEAGTIRRMIGHWRMLLEGIATAPDTPLARLPMMTPPEAQQILQEWNQTDAAVPADTVHGWFEAQVRRTPEALAVTFEEEAWTYRALDRQADRVAARLQQAGVTPGALVGICMNRSPAMVAGLFGILKAGGAYLPLDPDFPQARLAYILDSGQPAAVLTEADLFDRLPPTDLPLIVDDAAADGAPVAMPGDGPSLAYVLYTSGSTGQPKGVEVPHSALVNLLAAMQREPGFTAADSLLAVTTLSFDLAAFELFLPLVSGGRVHMVSRPIATDPPRLAGLIRQSGCTVMSATPATWRALVEAGWTGGEGLTILCGGEAMPRELADNLLKRVVALWNVYGPTETTIFATVHDVPPGTGTVSIGRPIANTQIYILDPAGNAVPVGIVGEIHIGGAGVARGYRNRPDLTRERFVERAIAPGARLYRTGDLARYRPDGTIEYWGRADNEQKIRGFRVAVEEIEAALLLHPGISAAAVRAWPDASGNKALTAYFVMRNGQEPTVAELRGFLAGTLPDFMIPARFMRLRTLPMTLTGKVDRMALPQSSESLLRSMVTPPQGHEEERLAALWKSVLNIAEVGRHENFFDLGGHSLLIAKLLRRVEREYGRRLAMAAVFQAPTVEAMARMLAGDTPLALPVIPVQPAGSRPALLWLDGTPRFRALAEIIGTDQPFLGIPVVPVLESEAASAMRLEDIAAYVVRAIREAQPHGPYFLGGWCNMGILTYEVAAQLVASGQQVGLVILLDAINPVSLRRISRGAFLLSRVRYHWLRLLRASASEKGRHLTAGFTRLCGIFHRFRPDADDRAAELRARLARSVGEYEPPVYAGDVALFQPTLQRETLDFRPGWAERVDGELHACDVPGTHATMFEEPHVRTLGALMRAVLFKAQERAARRQAGVPARA